MTNSSKYLRYFPEPSSRFQGPLCHGPGPASWPWNWVMDGGWDIVLSTSQVCFCGVGGHLDIPAVMCVILTYIYLLPIWNIFKC